jgi:hypothetical protein
MSANSVEEALPHFGPAFAFGFRVPHAPSLRLGFLTPLKRFFERVHALGAPSFPILVHGKGGGFGPAVAFELSLSVEFAISERSKKKCPQKITNTT